jgi:signal transduction histidine kinase
MDLGTNWMSIDIRQIRAEPHTEIGLLLQRGANVLVERWCDRANEEIVDAKQVHRETLRDQLPRFIHAIGRALMQSGDSSQCQYRDAALEHGQQRWDNDWSLSALVRDYQLLQLVILEHLEEAIERPLQYREIMAVTVHIDDAIAASIGAYVTSRDDHVRRLDRERLRASEETNRRKDEFIATLAHELRNSLAPIVNAINLLELTLKDGDPTVNETVEILNRQTKHVTCLVDDLFDLARIAQGRFELRKTQLDLTTILEQAIQISGHLFESRGHRFHVQLPADPLFIHADPDRLIQVVVNLLSNAAKYTEPGGETWLTAQQVDDEALITVRDTGVGIPPEMLSRVFDMFAQVDESSHYAQGGLGIGLTLVQRLTELHGGSVTCQSTGLGQGSEFVIRLKASRELAEIAATDPPHTPAVGGSCRLILIEDHADARRSLAALLERLGHSVQVAEDGTSGIERAMQFKPQVVLIDIGLPDLNGYEVARRLRAHFNEHVFLVALTGYGQEDDLRAALDAGFDAHLVKPADIGELTRLLSRVASNLD